MQNWYFSESDGRVVSPQTSVQLTPKAAAVLACLLQHRDEVVTIEMFLAEVWPGVHVTSDLVREYISDLRAALQDDARNPRYIETVRGKGFRLKKGVEFASPEALEDAPPRDVERRPTVAVLRPVSSGGPDLDVFAESVASDIINHLARFHYIGVVARHSTFSASEVTDLRSFARDVKADYLLESNFTANGDRIRIRFQLVDAATGQNLWAERFDRDAGDMAAGVDDITNSVVLAMTGWHGELHRAEFKTITRKRNENLNAFEHFVLGCDLEMRLDADSLGRSLHHLERSVTLDPTFARAWLVYALELRWAYAVIPGRDKSYLERSQKAFETAFNLAPSDPVTLALMSTKLAREGGIDTALSMLGRAERAMEGDSDAMVCVATAKAVLTDDIDDARAIYETALRASKIPPSWFHFAGAGLYFLSGDFERCISSSRSGPQEISSLIFRCLSHAMLGQVEMARVVHEDLTRLFPEVDLARFKDNYPILSQPRRRDYDAAVTRLTALLSDAGSGWPRLAT